MSSALGDVISEHYDSQKGEALSNDSTVQTTELLVLEKQGDLASVKIFGKEVTGKVVKYTVERAGDIERVIVEIKSDATSTN